MSIVLFTNPDGSRLTNFDSRLSYCLNKPEYVTQMYKVALTTNNQQITQTVGFLEKVKKEIQYLRLNIEDNIAPRDNDHPVGDRLRSNISRIGKICTDANIMSLELVGLDLQEGIDCVEVGYVYGVEFVSDLLAAADGHDWCSIKYELLFSRQDQ